MSAFDLLSIGANVTLWLLLIRFLQTHFLGSGALSNAVAYIYH